MGFGWDFLFGFGDGGAGSFRLSDMYTTWVLGDDVATQTVSAGGSLVSNPVDVRRSESLLGSLIITVGGTGTCKASARGSADGLTN